MLFHTYFDRRQTQIYENYCKFTNFRRVKISAPAMTESSVSLKFRCPWMLSWSFNVLFFISNRCLIMAGPPWFEFLVIFDFFAPLYRRGRDIFCENFMENSKLKLVKCTIEVARLHKVSIQSCTQKRPSPKVHSRSGNQECIRTRVCNAWSLHYGALARRNFK